MKYGLLKAFRRYDSICVVNADFTSDVDAVLPFPEFDHPCPALIVKINGLTMENHMKMRGSPVIEMPVAKSPLRGIQTGGDDITVRMIGKSKGFGKFI